MHRWSKRRIAACMGAGAGIALAFVASAAVLADAPLDVTAPNGTLTINDGGGFTNNPLLTLHVPATDDVGVVTVQVAHDGVADDPIPYADSVELALLPQLAPYAGDGDHWVQVTWKDAAGNASSSPIAHVTLDRVAPPVSSISFPADPDSHDGLMPVDVSAADGSRLVEIRFSSDGTAWSPSVPWTTAVDWHYLDPALGGGPLLGARKLYVQVQDAAGNWSATYTTAVDIVPFASISWSPNPPVTGQTITLTPEFPRAVTFPAGTDCMWEVMWGDPQSLYYGNRDETFGYFAIFGPASAGYCRPLSFTLPWMPYRRMLVHYEAYLAGQDAVNGDTIDAMVGGSPDDPAIVPVVGSTSRSITYSSMPLVYVLPEDYVLVVGRPTTYRAYAVHGAKITSKDLWSVEYLDTPLQRFGGTSFTFTPDRPGNLTVCWGTDSTRSTRWAACFDPPAKYRDRWAPVATAPVTRVGSGTIGTMSPVSLTWTGSDKGWGIARYQLQRSVDGGAWHGVVSTKARTCTQLVATGHTYRYRVRAVDKYGNVGAWATAATFRPAIVPDGVSAVKYAGTWSVVADAGAAGGAVHASGTPGSRATFTFSGRAVAWVAGRGPANGQAKVYVDKTLVTTVSLATATDDPRRIVFRRSWTTRGTHTIRIVVAGTAGAIVDVDGFVVLR